jgi:hypothetical protein
VEAGRLAPATTACGRYTVTGKFPRIPLSTTTVPEAVQPSVVARQSYRPGSMAIVRRSAASAKAPSGWRPSHVINSGKHPSWGALHIVVRSCEQSEQKIVLPGPTFSTCCHLITSKPRRFCLSKVSCRPQRNSRASSRWWARAYGDSIGTRSNRGPA